jgi:glycosyltransferase involved in cell wall biosynthesis
MYQGHHAIYLANIIEAGMEYGIQPVVAAGADEVGERLKEYILKECKTSKPKFLAIEPVKQPDGPPSIITLIEGELKNFLFMRKAYALASQQYPISEVFVPYLDYSLMAIGLLGTPFSTTSFSGITMRQRFHFRDLEITSQKNKLDWIKSRLFARALNLSSLRKLFVIDPCLAEFCNMGHMKGREKIEFFSDPVPTPKRLATNDAKRKLKLSADRDVVLLFGSIVPRKGVREMLDWNISRQDREKAQLLLVGQISDECRSIIAEANFHYAAKQIPFMLQDRYVDSDEEDLAYAAADYVWLGYHDFPLMSGVLAKAAQGKKKVIIYNYGLIEYYCKNYGQICVEDSQRLGLAQGYSVVDFSKSRQAIRQSHSWADASAKIYASATSTSNAAKV